MSIFIGGKFYRLEIVLSNEEGKVLEHTDMTTSGLENVVNRLRVVAENIEKENNLFKKEENEHDQHEE